MMKKLLLTGFVPFLDFTVNPSEQIVNGLNGQIIGNFKVIGRVLPVEFAQSGPEVIRYFEEINPDAVISLGLAGGRSMISVERVAINCIDGEADNSGVRYEDQPIFAEGPAAYFSTLPFRYIVNTLREHGYPAEISNTAGLYLCNNVMYHVLHYIKGKELQIPAGFIHLPASHQLAVALKRPVPSWSLETLTDAIRVAIHSLSYADE